MATHVQSDGGNGVNVTSFSVTFDSPVAVGNLIAAAGTSQQSGTHTLAFTDNRSGGSHTYSLGTNRVHPDDDMRGRVAYVTNDTNAAHTITLTASAQQARLSLRIAEIDGADALKDEDWDAQTTIGTSHPSGAVGADTGDVLISMIQINANRTISVPTNFTAMGEAAPRQHGAYRDLTSGGSFGAVWSVDTASRSLCLLASFEAAAAPGGGNRRRRFLIAAG